jgi:hypothetical protein
MTFWESILSCSLGMMSSPVAAAGSPLKNTPAPDSENTGSIPQRDLVVRRVSSPALRRDGNGALNGNPRRDCRCPSVRGARSRKSLTGTVRYPTVFESLWTAEVRGTTRPRIPAEAPRSGTNTRRSEAGPAGWDGHSQLWSGCRRWTCGLTYGFVDIVASPKGRGLHSRQRGWRGSPANLVSAGSTWRR